MRIHSHILLATGAAAVAIVLTGCAGEPPAEGAGRAPSTDSSPVSAEAGFASYDAGAVPGGPGEGNRYGLGSRATTAHIEKMDFDVGPEGIELPGGHGTVGEGAVLYKAQCAMCHGQNGEGMLPAFPRLVGRDPAAEGFQFAQDPKLAKTIGNYWPYATTIFDYVKRAMPLLTPGTLSDDQVYALTAHLLAVNDVIPDTATLDAAALRRVKMPYADRFVPDTRRGGPDVK